MPEKLRLVERDVFDSDAVFLAADVDDAIDHDEGIAMRQKPQRFHGCRRLPLSRRSFPLSSDLRPFRTKCRSVATPRFHSITGSPGKPAQRAPAGTFEITPARPPIRRRHRS